MTKLQEVNEGLKAVREKKELLEKTQKLQENYRELKKQYYQLCDEIQVKNKELDAVIKEVSYQKDSLNGLGKEIERKEAEETAKIKSFRKTLESSILDYKNLIKENREEKESLHSDRQAFIQEKGQLTAEKDRMQAHVNELEKSVEKKMADLKKQQDELVRQSHEVKEGMAKVKSEKQAAEAELSAAKAESGKVARLREDFEKELDKFEKDKRVHAETSAKEIQNIEDMQTKLQAEQDRLSDWHKKLKSQESEILSLESKLKKAIKVRNLEEQASAG